MNVALNLSQEEQSTGVTQIEREVVFYARLMDASFLKTASSFEHQEQWQVRIPKTANNLSEGRMRVRKTTTADGKVEYVQTLKLRIKEGEQETSVLVTEDIFEQFKQLSEDGMVKTRYVFDIEGREEKWEVDVFKVPNGNAARWCKIDYEFITDTPPPELPSVFEDAVCNQTTDPAERELIAKLYSELYIAKAV